jgi:hypothetical protein
MLPGFTVKLSFWCAAMTAASTFTSDAIFLLSPLCAFYAEAPTGSLLALSDGGCVHLHSCCTTHYLNVLEVLGLGRFVRLFA